MSPPVTIVPGSPDPPDGCGMVMVPWSDMVTTGPACSADAGATSTRDFPDSALVTMTRSPVRGSTSRASASAGPAGYFSWMASTPDSAAPAPDGAVAGSGTRYTVTEARDAPLSPMSPT